MGQINSSPREISLWRTSHDRVVSASEGILSHDTEATTERVALSPLSAVIRRRWRYTWLGQDEIAHPQGDGSLDRPGTTQGPSEVMIGPLRSPSPFDSSDVEVSLAAPTSLDRPVTLQENPHPTRLGARVLPRSATSIETTSESRRWVFGSLSRARISERLSRLRPPPGNRPDTRNASTISRSLTGSTPVLITAPPMENIQDGLLRDNQPLPPPSTDPLADHMFLPAVADHLVPGRPSRMARVRSSLMQPLPQLLQSLSDRSRRPSGSPLDVTATPLDTSAPADSRPVLPWLPFSSPGLDIDPTTLARYSTTSSTSHSDVLRSTTTSSDVRSSSTERTARRMSNPLRRRPSRSNTGEDQAAMLSRLLSVAAAATAASLVGNTDRAFSEAHDVGAVGVDGSFDGFLQALQNGSLAAALRNGGHEAGAGTEASPGSGDFAPVNFFRMFRFGATTANTAHHSGASTPADVAVDENGGGSGRTSSVRTGRETSGLPTASDSRMIPVIIVGIRSVTPIEGLPTGDGLVTPPIFDALSNLPLTMPSGSPRGGSGTLMRRTDRRARFARSRRASMSAVNYDSQRHHRAVFGSSMAMPDSRPLVGTTLPTVLSDSPPGPHPPPSTPADYGLSAYPSGNSTPSRRPSSASGRSLRSDTLPSWRESPSSTFESTSVESTIDSAVPPPLISRRRRLSDGEFGRHRDLGSGSSRRNGFVGDSDASAGNRQSSYGGTHEGTRSWIIYVLGGSYPEDHPILTTPSLFTDV